jgi:DtxR family Mn-dependent transcriptional regulator
MEFTQTEENYLKAIFKLSEQDGKPVSTNSISGELNTSAASVTDMIQRLSSKEMIHYEKYKGVTLTKPGLKHAKALVRKHRLWEVFLVEKLQFTWDEVHDIAEQLEHIQSDELVERLDTFLDHPRFDPHGDPIPDAEGKFTVTHRVPLADLKIGDKGVVVGVQEHSPSFLQHLDKLGLVLGAEVEILEVFEFDASQVIRLNGKSEFSISKQVNKNIFLKKSP